MTNFAKPETKRYDIRDGKTFNQLKISIGVCISHTQEIQIHYPNRKVKSKKVTKGHTKIQEIFVHKT